MDMGKCTSCILYIKQNPTTYKETTFSKKKEEKNGHQHSPRLF